MKFAQYKKVEGSDELADLDDKPYEFLVKFKSQISDMNLNFDIDNNTIENNSVNVEPEKLAYNEIALFQLKFIYEAIGEYLDRYKL